MTLLLILALQDLVAQLGAEDYATREAAMAALRERGPETLEALRPHLHNRDVEIAARVAVLTVEFEWLRMRDLIGVEVKPDGRAFKVTVTNRSHRAVVLQRSAWRVWVTYADGMLGGRFGGRRSSGCNLRDDDFFELEPGAAREVESVEMDRHDEIASVSVTYAYRTDAYLQLCTRACRHHAEPERPWNRALEVELSGGWSVGVREGE